MILVQVQKNWLSVLTGSTTAEKVVLGDWPDVDEQSIKQYGDVLVGIYRNTVVAVYDIDPEKTTTVTGGATRFGGTPSSAWSHLVGQPNPGEAWGPGGYTKPVQYLDTRTVNLSASSADVFGGKTVTVEGFVLTVAPSGDATIHVPAGHSVLVRTA